MNKTTKTVVVPFTGATVVIPSGAHGWELYSTMPGAGLAASRLSRALERALLAPSREDAVRIMGSALSADRKYGASDTEPRSIAEAKLTKGRGGDFAWSL
jgi:hypothetical protein